jgi:hypothetical protein
MAAAGAVLLLAGCGKLEVRAPAQGTTVAAPAQAAITAAAPWRLLNATLDGEDITDAFSRRSGRPGETAAAELDADAGEHILTITTRVGAFPFGPLTYGKAIRFYTADGRRQRPRIEVPPDERDPRPADQRLSRAP